MAYDRIVPKPKPSQLSQSPLIQRSSQVSLAGGADRIPGGGDKPQYLYRPVARGGGSGGSYDPPPVAHPKDFVPPFSNFVPPFSNFVPPFSNFVPPFSNFVPPFSNFVPPFSNFVPPFSNFVPPLEYGWRHMGNVQRGGVLVNGEEWGRFSNWWRHTGNVQGGGGAPGVPPIQVQTPPPTWLAGYGPAYSYGKRDRQKKKKKKSRMAASILEKQFDQRHMCFFSGLRPIGSLDSRASRKSSK